MSLEERLVLDCSGDPGCTHQSFKAECDIRTIMKKYIKTGVVSHINSASPLEGDFTNMPDFHTALNFIIDSENRFMSLPSGVRKRFNNNAAEFLDFYNDSANDEEAIKLGLKASPPFLKPVLDAVKSQPKAEPTVSST